MNVFWFTGLVWAGSLVAGLLGALTGLGGGVVLVPMLALAFHVDLRYAIGASLIAVIATSSGAASAYVREGYSNVRVGMFLEIATAAGAIAGAYIAIKVPKEGIGIVFGVVLLYSAWTSLSGHSEKRPESGTGGLARILRLDSQYPMVDGTLRSYHVTAVPMGFALMGVAGVLSGLLGIGSGAFKVLALDKVMRIPFKVSTTTSNFMIGVTAASSAGLYLHRGYIDPGLTMPVILGVLLGSMIGARVLMKTRVAPLRKVFGIVIAATAIQMIYSSVTGGL